MKVDDLGLERPAWWSRAACRDADPGVFVPAIAPRSSAAVELAAELAATYCNRCPVAAPCLEYALTARPQVAGFWAGTSERDRRRLRADRRAS